MSDEEAEARINALRNNARRGVKLMTSSRVPASYSNIPVSEKFCLVGNSQCLF